MGIKHAHPGLPAFWKVFHIPTTIGKVKIREMKMIVPKTPAAKMPTLSEEILRRIIHNLVGLVYYLKLWITI